MLTSPFSEIPSTSLFFPSPNSDPWGRVGVITGLGEISRFCDQNLNLMRDWGNLCGNLGGKVTCMRMLKTVGRIIVEVVEMILERVKKVVAIF